MAYKARRRQPMQTGQPADDGQKINCSPRVSLAVLFGQGGRAPAGLFAQLDSKPTSPRAPARLPDPGDYVLLALGEYIGACLPIHNPAGGPENNPWETR